MLSAWDLLCFDGTIYQQVEKCVMIKQVMKDIVQFFLQKLCMNSTYFAIYQQKMYQESISTGCYRYQQRSAVGCSNPTASSSFIGVNADTTNIWLSQNNYADKT